MDSSVFRIIWQLAKEIFKSGWKMFRSLFKNPKLVLLFCSFAFGLGILFASLFHVEIRITPEDQRNGWVDDPIIIQAANQGVGEIQIVGAKESSEGAQVYLWEFVKEINNGKHFPTFRQETGDCVSMGASNAVNYLQAVQIAKGEIGLQFHHAFQPYIYGISRTKPELGNGKLGRSAGSVGGWAAKGLKLYGALAGNHEGVPDYSGRLADKWGYKGVPDQFVNVASEFKVQSYAKVITYEQARDAIANGYPVTVASNQGFKMKPREYKGKMWGIPSGSWAHQMCFIGVDDQAESRRGKGGLYILNSWGATAHGEPINGEPPGGFWVDKKTVNRMLSQNDSYAFSSFDGFPAQELDFRVFGANSNSVVNVDVEDVPEVYSVPAIEFYTGVDESTGLGIGGIWTLITSLWAIYQLFKGKKVPINPFSKKLLLFLIFIPASVHADELSFINVFDSGPVTEPEPVMTGKEVMQFNVFDADEVEPVEYQEPVMLDGKVLQFNVFNISEKEITKSKPVIFAYKDLNSGCPNCDKLENQKSDLPVEIIWKQAPSWVTGYPTLHWQALDGTWKQYRGWGSGSKKRFPEIFHSTQQPANKNNRAILIDEYGKRLPL